MANFLPLGKFAYLFNTNSVWPENVKTIEKLYKHINKSLNALTKQIYCATIPENYYRSGLIY